MTQHNRRLAEALKLSTPRPAIIAEYPYYRADPAHWPDNLRDLRGIGVDAISAYVPWRLHEVNLGGGAVDYDFTGRVQAHVNLVGFLRRVHETGLRAILKPGPHIYAEVRLGGLPDRVVSGEFIPATTASGRYLTSEAMPLPSAFDQGFRSASRTWLSAFREQVIIPFAGPSGPIAAVQLGNEGIYGELNRPMTESDFSAPALAEWRRRMTHIVGRSVAAADEAFPKESSVGTRHSWARWSGSGLSLLLDEFRTAMGGDLTASVNLPLPELSGPDAEPEAWLCRAVGAVPARVLAGHTSWAGNAAHSGTALAAVWFGIRLLHADTVEDNWGFVWSDESYARPAVPVYHSLLGLAFESSTVGVYTGCTTWNWPEVIAPDPDGLIKPRP